MNNMHTHHYELAHQEHVRGRARSQIPRQATHIRPPEADPSQSALHLYRRRLHGLFQDQQCTSDHSSLWPSVGQLYTLCQDVG